MTLSDHCAVADVPERDLDSTSSSADLEGVDRLISDLAALVDAGLVVVHAPILGPARYAVGPDPGDIP
jgi:hypothetical protein